MRVQRAPVLQRRLAQLLAVVQGVKVIGKARLPVIAAMDDVLGGKKGSGVFTVEERAAFEVRDTFFFFQGIGNTCSATSWSGGETGARVDFSH